MKAVRMQNNSSNIHDVVIEIGQQARHAAQLLATAPTEQKNKALHAGAQAIRHQKEALLAANRQDMENARANGISGAFLDRLELNDARVEAMAQGLEDIAALDDPVGRALSQWERPNGLHIARISVPLGVIGIIYESRPNVTADAGALCLKSGNAAILRGGSESFHSSTAIMECLQQGLIEAGLPEKAIQLIPFQDREAVGEMLRLTDYIDVIVPRGGKGPVSYTHLTLPTSG